MVCPADLAHLSGQSAAGAAAAAVTHRSHSQLRHSKALGAHMLALLNRHTQTRSAHFYRQYALDNGRTAHIINLINSEILEKVSSVKVIQ